MSKGGETDMLIRKADTEGPNGMREQVGIQAIGIKPAQKRGRLPVKGNKLCIDLDQLKTRLVSHGPE